MVIYKITNLLNNKVYIGQTVQSLNLRWNRHMFEAKKGNKGFLYNAIRKYGKENFTIEELVSCFDLVSLNENEKYFISFYNSTSREKGYNILSGGNNSGNLPEEVKNKISESLKQRFKNGLKINNNRKGKSPWNKGLKGLKGTPRTIQCRKAISVRLKGRKLSDVTKSLLSKAQSNFQKNNVSKSAKPVVCLNTNERFSSASEASRYFNFPITAVSKVCNGYRKSYKGLQFQYIEKGQH